MTETAALRPRRITFHKPAVAPAERQENSLVFKYILVKLAARCNINCAYCYWFRDPSVYRLPKLLPREVQERFIEKLRAHVTAFRLPAFSVIFHGGEPMLFGKKRFRELCDQLVALEAETGTAIKKSITTNGVLVDREWVALFDRYGVCVTLSIDGSEAQHDRRRVDFRGQGTYRRVVDALRLLREARMEPGILAVCDPAGNPEELCATLVDSLGLKSFDVLVPDATHDDAVTSIAGYYTRLFDLWLDKYSHQGVEIRFLENALRGLLGLPSTTEAIGYGPISTLTMLSDGALEPLDVLRIAGDGSTRTSYNVRHDHFQDVQNDACWREARHASLNLCATCKACRFRKSCGGGYLPSRWSKARRYDNPSVYCEDLKVLLRHIWQRVSPTLYVAPAGRA